MAKKQPKKQAETKKNGKQPKKNVFKVGEIYSIPVGEYKRYMIIVSRDGENEYTGRRTYFYYHLDRREALLWTGKGIQNYQIN